MKEETSFTINVAPIRVWTHLADFGAYALWHPNYRFESDVPATQTLIPVRYALYKGDYRIRAEAKILASEKPGILSWSLGIGGMPVMTESYVLEAFGVGTRAVHSIAFEGRLARLVAIPFRRALRKSLAIQDSAFVGFLRKETRSVTGNRRRRRAQAARHAGKGNNHG